MKRHLSEIVVYNILQLFSKYVMKKNSRNFPFRYNLLYEPPLYLG